MFKIRLFVARAAFAAPVVVAALGGAGWKWH